MSLAVSGLRGMSHERSHSQGYTDNSVPIPESPEVDDVGGDEEEEEGEAHTVKRIHEALQKSPDRGDTLDLSRRGITGIGPEAVETFRRGVGKDMKGVWRCTRFQSTLKCGLLTDIIGWPCPTMPSPTSQ